MTFLMFFTVDENRIKTCAGVVPFALGHDPTPEFIIGAQRLGYQVVTMNLENDPFAKIELANGYRLFEKIWDLAHGGVTQ